MLFGIDFAAIWLFMITTGTNTAIVSLILKNVLLFGIIVMVTPWNWDNILWEKIKSLIANFKNRGEDEEIK